ncbi:PEP-CTERM sorting domain-containing protein [Limisphaera sp. 4302-co]|uniref:PEP-CTERM sorting domain-containing protein n=1 Tax=Limisphaera sp. 4302-co TaxID=3400417 RepID=UPI003C2C3652
MLGSLAARGQGTITFSGYGQHVWSGTNYSESGMIFQLTVPQGSSYDNMVILPSGSGNVPQNSTPFMGWFRQYNPYNYVSLSLTNGAPFGLVAVDLADPLAPSYTNLPISFIGYRLDGSTVTNTFVTPGGGANYFVSYNFGPEFASGLLSVQINADRWAMDNLVWVPEPRAYALVGLGLLALAWKRFHQRRKS